jgi:FkbH-like protein
MYLKMTHDLKYGDILKENHKQGLRSDGGSYEISVLSNVVVHQSKEIIEYILRVDGVNANVELGDYDNIVQNSQQMNDLDYVIIFWELSNLIDGLQYKIELLTNNEIDLLEKKIKLEIMFTVNNLNNCPLILINKFSSLLFSSFNIRNNNLESLAQRLNHYIGSISQTNLHIIDVDKIIFEVGLQNSFDVRYYYSSKAPYTISFFKSYAQYIKPIFMSANGKAKKALIFDCDNTLWKGVIGENGVDNIEMSPMTKYGAIFHEIQSIALSLSKQGVLIGLCSKNNSEDVDEVLSKHPDMLLQDDKIAIKKVNWSDKASNLKQIAKELNIGLDSLVFIDDSLFEVNLVKELLPEVSVLQVPEKLYHYPQMIRKNLGLFFNLSHTTEDSKKTEMYKVQKQRADNKSEFSTMEDYLASLELKVTIFQNNESLIPRMAQMTQKTNQFNLTTKRYTEREIKNMLSSSTIDVYAFAVKDRFGDSGVTGLCIVKYRDNNTAEIDSFLMSCRVIGRNIEYIFLDYIVNALCAINIQNIYSKYIETMKNRQVENFFDDCLFRLENKTEAVNNYICIVKEYVKSNINYIEVVDND